MSAIIKSEPRAEVVASDASVVDVTDRPLVTDTSGPIRLGFWVLIVGFGAFLLWAAFAPLDEGIVAPGGVSVATHRRPIQHMSGGFVKRVLVKEGQLVKAGDVLVELEDATPKAGYQAVRQNYLGLRAMESRILAEQAGASKITFHPDLIAAADEPEARQHMASQTKLFEARRDALAAELGAAREVVASYESQAAGFGTMLENRRNQAKLQAEQLANVRTLAAEGYAPRNQVLQLEQAQAELRSTIADLESARQRAQRSAAETRLRIVQRREEFQKESSAQLADVRRDVESGRDKLRALHEDVARTQLKSPVDGQVVGLQIAAVGGVVAPSQKLMEIVPQGEPLLIDAKIPPHLIDRVHVGDSTDVRFSGFAHSPQLVVDARLVTLSKDVVTEATPMGQVAAYYLARIEVTPEGMKALGNRVLQPGMPVEVLVRTGERSMLTYLLHPLIKRISQSLKEE